MTKTKEILLDDGLIEIKNYGKPSSVKVVDKRNPLLKRLHIDLEHVFADVNAAVKDVEEAIEEIIQIAKELKEKRLKKQEDKND